MGVEQWILIGVIALLLIAYPILTIFRNKKETEKVKTQSDNLKKGDKVLTTSGIYGTVIEIRKEGNGKVITIETGTAKNKGYLSLDSFAIYTVVTDEPAGKAEVKEVEAPKEAKTEAIEDPFKPAKKTSSKKK